MINYRLRDSIPAHLESELGSFPPLLAKLLYARGFLSKKDAEAFLSVNYVNDTHDPLLLKGITEAVASIVDAITHDKRIVVWSDYDTDGIPAGVILHDFFKKIGFKNFRNYIPDRFREGFGLNISAIESLKEEKVELIITCDCGINNVPEVLRARELGIEVVVTDHHLPGDTLPLARAIVNPKQVGCNYPEKMLCGAAVAFKLVEALCRSGNFSMIKPGWEKWLLDMVGIATLSDMVPLRGENRVLATYGLLVLRKSPRIGLQKLLRAAGVNQRMLTEDDIGFTLAPRINAASRMGSPMDAFRLLATEDEGEAGVLVKHLSKINDERKGVVASMVKEMKHTLKDRFQREEKALVVMGNPKWNPTLLGLAANSLMEEYQRPVFLWGRDGSSVLKGSCRSPGSPNLVSLMDHAAKEEIFIEYGGHACSGGFSVISTKVHLLEDALLSAYEQIPGEAHTTQELFVDSRLSIEEVSRSMHQTIQRLAPFGVDNEKPLFIFDQAYLHGFRVFGKAKNHLELSIKRKDGSIMRAIGFFMGDEKVTTSLRQGAHFSFLAHLEASNFGGSAELRLRIVAIL